MCCFTGAVEQVSGTRIFARPGDKGRQLLAYEMTYQSSADVAMVLPLPVPHDSPDNAVRFIDLSGYPDFFDVLHQMMPVKRSKGLKMLSFGADELPVVTVGSFEASFVPSQKAFSRLDERFRISEDAWKKLPQYADWGFAVFKLKKGNLRPHPMAFEFPKRNAAQIFFPTVHIHDGTVHDFATFDHELFAQPAKGGFIHDVNWDESADLAKTLLDENKAKGLIDPAAHVYSRRLAGSLKNADTWL
jgi:hypothetical protein